MVLNQFITLSVFSTHLLLFFQIKLFLYFVICVCLFCRFHFFAGFSNFVAGRFKKFSLWFFNVVKLLLVPLIFILSMMLASIACLIPFLLIFVAACLSAFLYFDVIAFWKDFEYSSLLMRYMFDVLSTAGNVLFDDGMSFRSLASVLWNLLSTFWNLRFVLILLNLLQIVLTLLLVVEI